MLKFQALAIPGVFKVTTTMQRDERGGFARLYCPTAFADAGLAFTSTQINLSTNTRKHTLRGMHYQLPPYAEAKLVRVVRGAIWDVVADIRPSSPTYKSWLAVELTASNQEALFVPEGCAHGFISLDDGTDVLYQMSRPHVAGHACGFSYDDPAFAIAWPAAPVVISQADRNWPAFS
jgi:dTDP-4-dehydrorhamnose 3,5-epimerase